MSDFYGLDPVYVQGKNDIQESYKYVENKMIEHDLVEYPQAEEFKTKLEAFRYLRKQDKSGRVFLFWFTLSSAAAFAYIIHLCLISK